MASTITADNGVSSGSAGLKTAADATGVLTLRTTTAGGTATTAMTISNTQVADFVNTPTVNGTPIGGGGSAGPGGQVFTANGTFTIPSGITRIKVTVIGGGGGGGGTAGNSTAGGNSTVASGTQTITTLTGGGGGSWSTFVGGTASNGDMNISGSRGISMAGLLFGLQGVSIFPTTYGLGGIGGHDGGTGYPGGGGGGTAIKWLTGLTSGNTLTVTVGAGGIKDSGTSGGPTNGTAGVVFFEW